MYFPESEAIARQHPDLARSIGLVDEQIASATAQVTFRPEDFAAAFHADDNQVAAVFELLAQQGVLAEVQMVECRRCHNLMPADRFFEAVEDEDRLACSACDAVFSRQAVPIWVYRLAPTTLARLDRDSPPPSRVASAVAGDEPLSTRAQSVLIAMLELGAVDSDCRQRTADISKKALGSAADVNALKGVMSDLATRGLTESKEGSGGGCWLTEKGCVRAAKLRQS